MLVGHAGGMDVHGCSTCGGVWLGTACAQKFAQGLPRKAIALAAEHAAKAQDTADTNAPIACPICGTTMSRTHAAAAKLDLDFCNAHGTWYDRNELERIAQAIENTRWEQAKSSTVAMTSTSAKSKKKRNDVVENVIDGAIIAGNVLDSVDTGGEVVGGVFDFFGSLFD